MCHMCHSCCSGIFILAYDLDAIEAQASQLSGETFALLLLQHVFLIVPL